MLAQSTGAGLAVPYLMSEQDVLFGTVRGAPSPAPKPLPSSGVAPREALEEILVEELSRPPCLVSFSGGRDSSALLAVALDVARRNGLQEPIAFTLRYPGNTDTEESAWQELVIEHLRARSWEVVEIAAGRSEILGPVATASLRANGLLWPPALHLETGWLSHANGATVITGEGGDEILRISTAPRRCEPCSRPLGSRGASYGPTSGGWPEMQLPPPSGPRLFDGTWRGRAT